MQLFLSLEHLETIVGLLIGLISILLFFREKEGLRREREMGKQPVGGAVRTYTFIKFTVLYGCSYKTITIVTSKITDHRSPLIYVITMKNLENYQNVTQT